MPRYNVKKVLIGQIKTNRGMLRYPLTYVEGVISLNEYVNVGYSNSWYVFTDPISVFGYNGVLTDFENDNKNISLTVDSQNQPTLKVKYTNASGDVETAYCAKLFDGSNAMIPFITIIIDESNTPYLVGGDSRMIINTSTTASNVEVFKPNTKYAFGLYARPNYTYSVSASVSNIDHLIASAILNESQIIAGDPYISGGTTEGSGGISGGSGSGSFDNTSDDVNIPDLPTYSAVDTGFITIFNPSITQLKNLANYMWSNDLFNLDTWKKIFDNPMDAILGLSIVPVDVPEGSTDDVTVGNIITTVSMTKASSQYVKVDCGSLEVKEYWGGYMDYAPYTKAELYLPYCGTHPVNIDDIMGKTVQVVYHVDILSGACVAYVKCGTSVLYSFVGQCSSSIPITAGDMTSVINGILSISASVGTMVATGGMSAPITALVGTQLATSTASNVMNMKPHVEKSGSMSGTGGMMGIQTPYLIITRPRQCLPSNQNTYTGYPSYITSQLSSLSGFTTIDSIHLTNMSCTDEEKSEIENILMQGVIL